MSSPSTVLTLGLGSWSSVNLLLTLGLGVSTIQPIARDICVTAIDTTTQQVKGIDTTTQQVVGIDGTLLTAKGINTSCP